MSLLIRLATCCSACRSVLSPGFFLDTPLGEGVRMLLLLSLSYRTVELTVPLSFPVDARG